jgi:transcriptional regulator with PAS, ATPase and Fis domain
MNVGYASGYASFCLGKSVYFMERQCHAKGDPVCTIIGKDIDSWGDEIKPTLEFFHAGDIQATILTLTEQLREQQLEVARQRRKLAEALGQTSVTDVELRSRRYLQILELAERVARFDTSLLITGETGVGKEVLARHIHELSPRGDHSFVAVNCAALPETLLESTLFGHKAGAFTGATRNQAGLFEEANKGTILLDEMGDTSAATQLKLLRVVQEQEILRVGETQPRKVNVRVIAATNRDMQEAVADGSFREDLFYRLEVVHIEIPPLRERQEDILPLARHFVLKCSKRLGLPALKIDATCLDRLLDYPWPGNIRELENAIEHAAILCREGVILPEHLPAQIGGARDAEQGAVVESSSLADVEWNHIQRVLALTRGNRAEAARILEISPATLYRRLSERKQT